MSSPKRKQDIARKTQKEINNDIALFLQNGGEIQQFQSGVSGQKNIPGPKHIVISKKTY